MPALITHRLFGEEAIDRLPEGIIATEDDRIAFLIGNQGPDPFFFRFRTTRFSTCMTLGKVMHRARMSRQLAALHDGVSRLQRVDAGTGRAFALGLLSHYILDRTAHPFIYAQQWGVQDADPSLADDGGRVHAVIESDLDLLMLQLKRGGATVKDHPPESELVTTARVNKVAGALMSHVAGTVYHLPVAAGDYGGAVADMRLIYRLIEPAGAPISSGLSALEGLGGGYSLLGALAHRVTTEQPTRAGNMEHAVWENPFTLAPFCESFPELFDRALDDYPAAAIRFIEGDSMEELTRHINYSGRILGDNEEYDQDE